MFPNALELDPLAPNHAKFLVLEDLVQVLDGAQVLDHRLVQHLV